MDKQISFDRSLYLPEAVEAAAAAFVGHAQIEITPSSEAVLAVITAAGDDPESVAHAFCNYVLQETIARIHQANLPEVG